MCCKFPTVLLWFHTKSLDQTSLAWHEYSDHLWCLGVIKRLWWRRLISVWLKLAELPYLASSQRKRKEAVKRLAKRQRYHMITTADGYTSHLFFCARSLSGGMWKLHLYTVLSAGNKLFLLVITDHGHKVHFQNDVAAFTIFTEKLLESLWVNFPARTKMKSLACSQWYLPTNTKK